MPDDILEIVSIPASRRRSSRTGLNYRWSNGTKIWMESFAETETEKNRQTDLPPDLGYERKDQPTTHYGREERPQGSTKKHSSGIGKNRTDDGWDRGVTYINPSAATKSRLGIG